ncbi:MAG TPA: hypothetical protein VFQ77_07195 [Pseudonocardiaceae bacterium]|nr:hypothetical protein [Pseudonocardiaceae bacterium]
MTLDELRTGFDRLVREAFRLEQEQSYAGVPDPGWAAWKAGQPLPARTAENDEFLRKIAAHVGAGRRVYRVVIVDRPISEYLRYELTAFRMHVAVGEDVYVVWRDAHPDLAELVEDFWMLDEELIAIMRYDEEKRFVEVVQPTEPLETYMARRDLAMKHAVPLEQWMAKHEI